ncbi:MAG: methyltransferase domain-containing protein [Gemmatimonadales bacterium]|nr:MAG: methyltransferase domain-containing protein [Gemmatimonadales bacterium]
MSGNVEASRETGGWHSEGRGSEETRASQPESRRPEETEGWQLEGRGSEAYEAYLVPRFFRPWAERLLTVSGVVEGDRVLDVGCGTGIVARSAVPLVGDEGHVVGVDLNQAMLETARMAAARLSPSVEWRQEDAMELSFPDDSFDRVLAQQVLQFVEDPVGVLAELRRVLRPGGRLGLNVLRPIRYNPSYALLAEVLERHVGEEAGVMMRSPFPEWSGTRLREFVLEAGFGEVSLYLDIRAVRYPSSEEYLRQEAASSPLAEPIAGLEENVRRRMIHHLEEALQDYTDHDGVVFPMETHLSVAN